MQVETVRLCFTAPAGGIGCASIGAELDRLEGHAAWVKSAFSPDGSAAGTAMVVNAGADGTARLWDAATGSQLRRLEGHTASVTSAAFSPDGRWIVTASEDGMVRL